MSDRNVGRVGGDRGFGGHTQATLQPLWPSVFSLTWVVLKNDFELVATFEDQEA